MESGALAEHYTVSSCTAAKRGGTWQTKAKRAWNVGLAIAVPGVICEVIGTDSLNDRFTGHSAQQPNT